jgi:hypothetical protein
VKLTRAKGNKSFFGLVTRWGVLPVAMKPKVDPGHLASDFLAQPGTGRQVFGTGGRLRSAGVPSHRAPALGWKIWRNYRHSVGPLPLLSTVSPETRVIGPGTLHRSSGFGENRSLQNGSHPSCRHSPCATRSRRPRFTAFVDC